MMMITCSIYLYCRSYDNTPVYVGQTDRDVKLRDHEHLMARKTKFDKSYTDSSVYSLQVLETYASEDEMDRAEWMDERERHYIDKHSTYRSYGGLNYTRGGQGVATLQRQREACRKKSFDWQLGKMLPLLHRIVDLGLDVNVPQRGYKDHAWTKQLGKYQNHLRTGNTACPDEIRSLLDSHSFEWDYGKAVAQRRNEEMLSLLRRVVDTGLDINVPARGHKDHAWTKQLGVYQDHLRKGNTARPKEICEFLNTHGFFWSCKDLWKHFRGRYPAVAEMPGTLPDDWVAEFQRAHAQHRRLCTRQRKVFGAKALSDEQVRARYT